MATSNLKRKLSEINDAESSDNTFLYDPSSPLYSFKFIDQLVEQYCPRSNNNEQEVPELDLECCPRAYEESFLREPVGNEQHCANDKECEGLKIKCDSPFILREFLLPSELAVDASERTQRNLCLMCQRLMIAKQFFHYESAPKALPSSVYCSKYFNVCESPGEYSIKDCIVNGENGHSGLVMPVVLHNRSAYEYRSVDGVQTYAQDHFGNNTSENDYESAFLRKGAILIARESIARSV